MRLVIREREMVVALCVGDEPLVVAKEILPFPSSPPLVNEILEATYRDRSLYLAGDDLRERAGAAPRARRRRPRALAGSGHQPGPPSIPSSSMPSSRASRATASAAVSSAAA
ncbi:MAG: hypothetical protein QOJ89_3611 [bacterium]